MSASLPETPTAAPGRPGPVHRPPDAAAPGAAILLSAAAVAARLAISRSTLWHLHASGRVPGPVRLGGRTLWRAAEIDAWVDADCPTREGWSSLTKKGGR